MSEQPRRASCRPHHGTRSFDEVYDPETIAAIDSWRAGGGIEPTRGWRGGVTAGALLVGGLAGLKAALDDDTSPAVEEPGTAAASTRLEAVTVLFVPGDPSGTVAVVRPWLVSCPGPAILAAIA